MQAPLAPRWRGSRQRAETEAARNDQTAIVFVPSNYSLSFPVLGLLFALVAIARAPKPLRSHGVIERLLAWHIVWSIGVCYLYNFVVHGFFGTMSAAFIGWADSPFQFEVATASLGFAAVGFLTASRSFDLRLAAIVGAGWGGVLHGYRIPVIGAGLLWVWWRAQIDRAPPHCQVVRHKGR